MNILDAMKHPDLFGPHFRDSTKWAAWRAFLATLFGLPMDDEAKAISKDCTGHMEQREGGYNEAWLIVGRRGGKSYVLAATAVFLAIFRDWRPYLSAGEVGTVMILACDRRQARTILRYISGLTNSIPALRDLVGREWSEGVELTNGIAIEVHTASWRSIRGYTVVAALCDEIAFWRSDDSVNPDHEILSAIRPAMATIPGAMLLCASSPYAQRGALYEAYRRFYGKKDAPALVWRADTRRMNPGIPQRVIDEAYERDPDSAAAEYGAEFRRDVQDFLSRGAVDACVIPGRFELPYLANHNYFGFVDPSGGSQDSFTLAISHMESQTVVLDVIRETRPPFSPDAVVQEFTDLLKSYRLLTVSGDRYGGEWPRERFRQYGICYEPCPKPKSDLYLDTLPLINGGRVELLDHTKMSVQLVGLERRTARSGKDSVDHVPGGHDDVANAVAGALSMATRRNAGYRILHVVA